MQALIQYFAYLAILIFAAWPLGLYINKAMNGERTLLTRILGPLERGTYRFLRIKDSNQMSWKKYLWAVLAFSFVGLVFVMLLQMLQAYLWGNPEKLPNVPWDLAFNTASSYVTNTNWQAYAGESTLSYLSQALALTVQNFVSAGTGIAVLFALARAFITMKNGSTQPSTPTTAPAQARGLGNFWVDLTRSVIYVLLPLNILIATCLVAGGVVQSWGSSQTVQLSEPVAVNAEHNIISGAHINTRTGEVTVNGEPQTGAQIVTEQYIPSGPAASQVAIKQTGTNGGGFMGANSAHPLENATPFTNILEMLGILIIPVSLCFSFGAMINNRKQGRAFFATMLICLILALAAIAWAESSGTPQLGNNGMVSLDAVGQAGGNMEGKETRFGIATSSTWAAFTTAASSGSVNAMADSFTPFGGMVMMIQMQLGEVIFGGVGSGLYGMIAFAILTVFIAGLMVGRTPEFLGKKIEPYEMKWAVIVCLATPVAILVSSGIGAALPGLVGHVGNTGPHGFSEMLYTFTSAGANNGSAFAGFNGNSVFLNITLGLSMIFARFVPIMGTLAIAGSLIKKKNVAVTSGTLSTTNPTFIFLLIVIILLVGALSFFPALALGPIAEFFTSIF